MNDGIENFKKQLDGISPSPVSQNVAEEAYRNLSGFMSLLVKINEREQIVPTKPARKKMHENQ